jgi:hypothetical protein
VITRILITLRAPHQAYPHGIPFDIPSALQQVFFPTDYQTLVPFLKNTTRPLISLAIIIGVSPLNIMGKSSQVLQMICMKQLVSMVRHQTVVIDLNGIPALVLKNKVFEVQIIPRIMKYILFVCTTYNPMIDPRGAFFSLLSRHSFSPAFPLTYSLTPPRRTLSGTLQKDMTKALHTCI